jgi:hypothetical protein
MEINLKSRVGRAFSATFDPITVAVLLGLAAKQGATSVRNAMASAVDIKDKTVDISDDVKSELALILEVAGIGSDTNAGDTWLAMEAWRTFLAEYKLLETGSGSERACLESFMDLCELLQSV